MKYLKIDLHWVGIGRLVQVAIDLNPPFFLFATKSSYETYVSYHTLIFGKEMQDAEYASILFINWQFAVYSFHSVCQTLQSNLYNHCDLDL